MLDRNLRPGRKVLDGDRRRQLTGQSRYDGRSQTRLRHAPCLRHADPVIRNRQFPALGPRPVIDAHDAFTAFRKRVLQGVDHQFGDDQSDADRDLGVHGASIAVHLDPQLLMVGDH